MDQTQPNGTFAVGVDPFTGLLSKALEVTGNVLVARNENKVSPAPSVPGTANNTATPDQAKALAANSRFATMSPTTKVLLVGGAIVAGLALLWVVANRK